MDRIIKIVVVGASGIGKSSMLNYYTNNIRADKSPTIGIEFHMIELDDGRRLQIWDTAGQEKYDSITKLYYRKSHGAIICFSIVDRSSFDKMVNYYDNVKMYAEPYTQIIIVGTFLDDEKYRQVSKKDITKFINRLDEQVEYVEVSSLTGENVTSVVEKLMEKIDENVGFSDDEFVELHVVESDEKKCCW